MVVKVTLVNAGKGIREGPGTQESFCKGQLLSSPRDVSTLFLYTCGYLCILWAQGRPETLPGDQDNGEAVLLT